MSKCDVLFVEPNSAKESYQDLADTYAAIEIPTWSILLSSACRVASYEPRILDCNAERLTIEQSLKRIEEINPKLIVFVSMGQNPNASTCNMVGVYKLAREIRKYYNYKIASFGSHTSALPKQVLAESFIDFILIGDGVYTLRNLLKTDLVNGLDKVKGLGWKKDNIIQLNEPEIVVPGERLDIDLPGGTYDLLPFRDKPFDLYRAHFWHALFDHNKKTPFASIYTSLGCPKKCQFCMINSINRDTFDDRYTSQDSSYSRYWTPNFILNQLEKIAGYGIETCRLCDELFYLNPRHYQPILQGIIDRGLKYNFWGYSRPDSLNTKYLELFKKAGFNYLAFGVEHANQDIRVKDIEKGHFKNVNIKDVINKTREMGINVIANYIYGFENDSFDTMQQTLDLSLELNTEMMNCYTLSALPGSPISLKAKEAGLPLPDSFEGYSFLGYETLPLPTKFLSSKEVLAFRDKAWKAYFTNPTYLNMVESKFGVEQRKNVEDMSKITLRRKLLEI